MAENRPFMPVETLADEAAPESDYNDGDNAGWYSTRWNADTRELLLKYQADEDEDLAPYRSTEHVFRLGAQARVGGPSLGEVAYAGYRENTRGISLVSGVSLPPWGELEPEMQAAWQAAADAVRVEC